MATISRAGIVNGSVLDASQITNIIDALDGTGVGITVVATGSFSGSLAGTASFASIATTASYVLQAVSSSFATTATSATTASYVLQAVSASFAVSASYAPGAAGATFPYTGSAIISGSLAVTGSTSILGDVTMTGQLDGNLDASDNLIVDLSLMGKSTGIGKFVVPIQVPPSPTAGALYWDDASGFLWIYQLSTTSWIRVELS